MCGTICVGYVIIPRRLLNPRNAALPLERSFLTNGTSPGSSRLWNTAFTQEEIHPRRKMRGETTRTRIVINIFNRTSSHANLILVLRFTAEDRRTRSAVSVKFERGRSHANPILVRNLLAAGRWSRKPCGPCGVEVHAAKLLPSLKLRGHEFLVITTRSHSDEPDTHFYQEIPIYRFPFWDHKIYTDIDVLTRIRR